MRGKVIQRPWNQGDAALIGLSDRMLGKTDWIIGKVISVLPFQVETQDGTVYDRSKDHFLLKKPSPEEASKADSIQATKVYNPETLKNALVKIIQEGDTEHPNSTVQRIVRIAKDALGEI